MHKSTCIIDALGEDITGTIIGTQAPRRQAYMRFLGEIFKITYNINNLRIVIREYSLNYTMFC